MTIEDLMAKIDLSQFNKDIEPPGDYSSLTFDAAGRKAVQNSQVWTVEMNEAVNHLRKRRKRRDSIKTRGSVVNLG